MNNKSWEEKHIGEQVRELKERIEKLEKENLKFGKLKTLKIDKEGKYLIFVPAELFSLAETSHFAEAMRAMGFPVTFARLPSTKGIKVVERDEAAKI